MSGRLQNRVAIVTGAGCVGPGWGNGRATAVRFAEEGAKIFAVDRDLDSVTETVGHVTKSGGEIVTHQCDVTSSASVKAMVQACLDRFGRIDVLVNNAGVAIGSPPDEPVTRWLADWETTMAVNLTATALLCRAAVAHFQTAGGGRIVNIASRAAFRGDTPDYLAYAASKGGMVALTRSIARGYGKDAITAFVVAPGFTRTEMAQDFIDQYGEDFAMKDVALNRMTEPKDIAPTVLFLASGLADHATGSTIDINAGSYVR
jgi:NAD(P)-dependent dehydrogenase (short-subunit alcohol dehydrogenase family)